jgi:hypothetical protein
MGLSRESLPISLIGRPTGFQPGPTRQVIWERWSVQKIRSHVIANIQATDANLRREIKCLEPFVE